MEFEDDIVWGKGGVEVNGMVFNDDVFVGDGEFGGDFFVDEGFVLNYDCGVEGVC